MNWLSPLKSPRRAGVGLSVLAILAYAVSILFVAASDHKAAPHDPPATKKVKKVAKKEVKKLTGAQLYSINCNRCHPERYPTEWTSAQWKTLIMHMRVRANLPAKQAKKILRYLQEDSGN